MRWSATAVLSLAIVFGAAGPASATSILGNFVVVGSGHDLDPAFGGGTIQDVFEAAASYWEQFLVSDRTITIDYYWDDINTGVLAFGGLDVIGIIQDNPWFVDPTPLDSSEYSSFTATPFTLGGVDLTYSLRYSGGLDPANGFDLLTVMLHEIGHVLAGANVSPDCQDGDIDVTAPSPFPGLEIPTEGCFHLARPTGYVGPNPLMFPFLNGGERSLIADPDLLFVAQAGEFQIDPSRFAAVPEPATVSLLGIGLAAGAARRLRPRARAFRP